MPYGIPVVSLRSTTGYVLSSLRDGVRQSVSTDVLFIFSNILFRSKYGLAMKIIGLVLPVLFVVSCNVKKPEKPVSPTPEVIKHEKRAVPTPAGMKKIDQTTNSSAASPVFNVKDAQTLVGQEFEVVKPVLERAKLLFRVVQKDGEALVTTADYRPERLNFKIDDGVIIEVSQG